MLLDNIRRDETGFKMYFYQRGKMSKIKKVQKSFCLVSRYINGANQKHSADWGRKYGQFSQIKYLPGIFIFNPGFKTFCLPVKSTNELIRENFRRFLYVFRMRQNIFWENSSPGSDEFGM